MSLSPPTRLAREGRYALLSRLALAGFALVALGLLRLQVVQHDKYLELSKENRVRLEVVRAPRGVIYDASGEPTLLRPNAPFPVLAAVEESRAELPGLEVQVEPVRRYPHGRLAAHLLGYAGEVNDQELDSLATSGYRLGDLIGRTGVERRYEEILRGRDGAEFVVVNANGKRVSTLTEEPPRPPVSGHDIVLTINLKVQTAM